MSSGLENAHIVTFVLKHWQPSFHYFIYVYTCMHYIKNAAYEDSITHASGK